LTYEVKYQHGPYSGVRTVSATDEEQAIEKARAWVWRESSLVMAYNSFKVVRACEEPAQE
jgi:1,2-phenylacetyl-CoA epoxidase PaaB subunit